MRLPRHRSRREISITEVSVEGPSERSCVTDLGLDGVFIDTINPLPVGTILRLSFGHGSERYLTTQGIVVHSTPSIGMSIQFADSQALSNRDDRHRLS